IAGSTRPRSGECGHFSNPAAQFSNTVNGVWVASSSGTRSRNVWPSGAGSQTVREVPAEVAALDGKANRGAGVPACGGVPPAGFVRSIRNPPAVRREPSVALTRRRFEQGNRLRVVAQGHEPKV